MGIPTRTCGEEALCALGHGGLDALFLKPGSDSAPLQKASRARARRAGRVDSSDRSFDLRGRLTSTGTRLMAGGGGGRRSRNRRSSWPRWCGRSTWSNPVRRPWSTFGSQSWPELGPQRCRRRWRCGPSGCPETRAKPVLLVSVIRLGPTRELAEVKIYNATMAFPSDATSTKKGNPCLPINDVGSSSACPARAHRSSACRSSRPAAR